MNLKLPWTMAQEDHLGAHAYSLMEEGGLRVAVGLTREDAGFICKLVNATAMPLTLDTIYAYFAGNGYTDLVGLPEREVTAEVYNHFLGILPPEYLPGGGFYVIERITGDVVSSYWKRGDRYFHRYVSV